MKQKNVYTKMIFLQDVKDDKELFALQERNNAPLYNKQTTAIDGILITSVKTGKSYWKKPKTNIYIKTC